jgi:hypothetical protein
MSIVNVVESGSGSGHTTFCISQPIAIKTNHTDTFMTLIDTNNHTKLGDITGMQLRLPLATSHKVIPHQLIH